MMDDQHLHLFIDEDIYVIQDEQAIVAEEKELATDSQKQEEIEAEEPLTIHVDPPSEDEEYHEETPKIPEVHHHEELESKEEAIIPLAVFHEATATDEVELLQKIIDACGIEKDQYQVFANGFNKEVKFKKGLVFVAEAKAFYTPIPYKESQFLCSKPLSILKANVQEKGKLWNALKSFVQ